MTTLETLRACRPVVESAEREAYRLAQQHSDDRFMRDSWLMHSANNRDLLADIDAAIAREEGK